MVPRVIQMLIKAFRVTLKKVHDPPTNKSPHMHDAPNFHGKENRDHLGNILLFGGRVRFNVLLQNISCMGECSPCLFICGGDRFRSGRTSTTLTGLSMSTKISMCSSVFGEEVSSPPHSCDCDTLSPISVYISLGVGKSMTSRTKLESGTDTRIKFRSTVDEK